LSRAFGDGAAVEKNHETVRKVFVRHARGLGSSADTISTDELWPGGGTGLSLTGANMIVGVWEVGGVPRTNHMEFGSRVIDREGGNPFTSHGTGVALGGANTLKITLCWTDPRVRRRARNLIPRPPGG
jgi:hypothetical protein